MPPLSQTLKHYWKKRLVRALVALLILGAAVFAQYRLANIPLPIDVDESAHAYTPQTAELIKQEVLTVDGPLINRSTGVPNAQVLFSGTGAELVSVEARFDAAKIGKGFMRILRTDPNQELPPESLETISFTPQLDEEDPNKAKVVDPNSAPCRTSLDITLAENGTMPGELHFFQQTPGSAKHRSFEIRAIGADLVVRLETRNFAKGLGVMTGPNCAKTLAVGSWSHSFSAPAPIDIVVPAGASMRLAFSGAADQIGGSSGGFYEPFKLVALPVNARAIRKINQNATGPALFEATQVDQQKPLVLRYLRIGADQLQLDYAGNAMVQKGGEFAETFSILAFAKSNPLLAIILGMLDAALLEWLRRMLMGAPKGT